MLTRLPLEQRFWSKVKKGKPDECWDWVGGCRPGGYGNIMVFRNGKKVMAQAHRVVWALTRGTIPKGLHVLHRCDRRRCVNPQHLFLGTAGDNIRDAVAKGRQVCGYGIAAKRKAEERRREHEAV